MIKERFDISVMHLSENVIHKRRESTIMKMINIDLWRELMKVCKTKYWPIYILIASFLIWGCANSYKYEGGSKRCGRGQYWSQTAAGCVLEPGP